MLEDKAKKIFLLTLALSGVILLSGCGQSVPITSEKPVKIQLSNQNTTTTDASTQNNNSNNSKSMELKIETTKAGTGERVVKAGDTISVQYLGKLENGTKFDSSYDRNQPFTFKVGAGQVIKGWEQGFLGAKVGEKRTLTIPSELGYGSTGAGGIIPPNATLIFEVELISIQ